jgi:hypothetical protein
MVTIISFKNRKATSGKDFIALEIQGEPEFIQSQLTGQFYLTARRCSIPSTFSEEVAQSMIGKVLPGNIVRVQAEEPYDYTIPETGEVIKLAHTYEYRPDKLDNLKLVGYDSKLVAAN